MSSTIFMLSCFEQVVCWASRGLHFRIVSHMQIFNDIRVCVNHLNRCKASLGFHFGFHYNMQGAQAHCGYLCQQSYSTMGEAEIDLLRVPAIFRHGIRLSPEPARRFLDFSMISMSVRFSQCCHSHSGTLTWPFQPTFSQNKHEVFLENPVQSFQVTELFFARTMRSTSQFAITILSKCVCVCGTSEQTLNFELELVVIMLYCIILYYIYISTWGHRGPGGGRWPAKKFPRGPCKRTCRILQDCGGAPGRI